MLEVRILTPTGLLFEGEVVSLTLPGTMGSFTVLERHAPIISSLDAGEVVCHSANGEHRFECNGGFVGVENNVATVCIE